MSDVNGVVEGGEGTGSAVTGGENPELLETGSVSGNDGGDAGSADGGAAGGEGGTGASGDGAGDEKVNKRFSQVTRERDEALRRERESQELLKKALETIDRATPKAPVEAPKPVIEEDPEPVPPEFVDIEQYQRDMAEYARKVSEHQVRKQLKDQAAAAEQARIANAQREQQQQIAREWTLRREAAIQELPDYAEVAENPAIPISNAMAVAIATDDFGPKLAYHLGKHPEVAERISKLPTQLQLMELGILKAELKAPPKPQVTKVPPPIKPTTGATEVANTRSDDELSMEEYAAKRNASRK